MRVRSLDREDPQEESMATHSLCMAISACKKDFWNQAEVLCAMFTTAAGLAQGGAPSDCKPKGEQQEAVSSKRLTLGL